ncbi:DUF5707 domain-containing protein [Streptomyces sp. NBC_00878]|uniref:DUF5707 domain-containing protein n=1 Tax=Streptomyces sp. NBC_00878 TaxID=2975854 RepID=UPI0022549B7E|nr:DUF5707 domain-containing protein [Streptomyces sp. NBC_00878]MCX4911626.1 DUF5707 domain-containing protein [Streptomyces sp. NBC_00878]
MSKRILASSLVGVVVVGGIAAGGLAVASASASSSTEPSLENVSARYVAPTDSEAGSLTFTADVSDDSGVKDLKVLPWPAGSGLDVSEKDLQHVDSAKCESTSAETSRCTYTLRVTKKEAAELDQGRWYVSTLATAKDGDTTFESLSARFVVAD